MKYIFLIIFAFGLMSQFANAQCDVIREETHGTYVLKSPILTVYSYKENSSYESTKYTMEVLNLQEKNLTMIIIALEFGPDVFEKNTSKRTGICFRPHVMKIEFSGGKTLEIEKNQEDVKTLSGITRASAIFYLTEETKNMLKERKMRCLNLEVLFGETQRNLLFIGEKRKEELDFIGKYLWCLE